MIKKIMYFILVIAIGIAVYYVDYTNNQYKYTLGLVEEALQKENYVDVAKIFGGLFDSKSIVNYENDNNDKIDLVVYPSTTLSQVNFGEDATPDVYARYEKSYNFYLYKNKYDLATYTDEEKGANVNNSGIKFYSNENEYMYYFIVNSEMNPMYYKENPFNFTEALLNDDRDYVTTFETVGFISISFTQIMLEEIVKQLGGNITKVEVVDAKGNSVIQQNIKLDFTDTFFVDCDDMIKRYDEVLAEVKKYENDEAKQEEISKNFEKEYNKWIEEFEKKNHPTYTFGFDEEYLNPKSLRKKSIGALAIYLAITFVLYFIFFHRKLIKKLIYKIIGKHMEEEEDEEFIDDDYSIEDDMIDVDEGKVTEQTPEEVLIEKNDNQNEK